MFPIRRLFKVDPKAFIRTGKPFLVEFDCCWVSHQHLSYSDRQRYTKTGDLGTQMEPEQHSCYRLAKNGYNGIALFQGLPILYTTTALRENKNTLAPERVEGAVEMNGGFHSIPGKDGGWSRLKNCWVVNKDARDYVTFERVAQLGTTCQTSQKEETFLMSLPVGDELEGLKFLLFQ
jgi:hypothetical protein